MRLRAAVLLAGAAFASRCEAAPVTLKLRAQTRADALIETGVAAGLSMLNVAACPGEAPPLQGRYEPTDALRRIIGDAPCRYVFVDATTVRFVAAPRAPLPRPRQPPVPPPPSAEPEAATPLQAVVVTAGKRPELLFDSPNAATVVSAARLIDSDSLDVQDVAAQIAAVVATNLGPGRDKLLLRGVSDGAFTGRTRSTVATYLDDAPITYNAPDPDLVLTDVERIEILRGPQGALYGGGSVGGVYRIVTRAPDAERFSGSIRLRGASVEGGGAGSGAEITANAPLAPGKLAARASTYSIDDPGFLQNEALRQSNVDHTRRTGGRLALAVTPGGGWSATLSAAVQDLKTQDSQYATSQPGGGGARRANLVNEAHANGFGEVGLVVTGPAGPLTLHSSTSYVRHRFSNRYDASSALSFFDSPSTALGVYDEHVASEMVVQDLYLATPEEAPLGVVAGALASHLDVRTPSALSARSLGSPAPVSLFSEERHDQVDELALYGDLRLRFLSRWSADVGARLFHTAVSLKADTRALRVGGQAAFATDRSATNVGVSPKLSLQYAWSADASAYALVSTGERAGGFNTGGLRPAPLSQAAYRRDRLVNAEVGVKTRFWDGRGELTGSLFQDRWTGIQTDQFYASGLPYTINVGTGRITGLEADAAVRLGRLTLEANTLLTRSSLGDVAPGFERAEGRSLPGVPSVAATLFAEYRRPLTQSLALLLGGRAGYTGRAPLTFTPMATPVTDASYIDAKLWAQLVTARYRLALNVSNPANASADTFAYGNPFSFGQVRQSTPQRPRLIELVASASF